MAEFLSACASTPDITQAIIAKGIHRGSLMRIREKQKQQGKIHVDVESDVDGEQAAAEGHGGRPAKRLKRRKKVEPSQGPADHAVPSRELGSDIGV